MSVGTTPAAARPRRRYLSWAEAPTLVTRTRIAWAEGKTAAEIARDLSERTGREITRNAVLGLIRRREFKRRKDAAA